MTCSVFCARYEDVTASITKLFCFSFVCHSQNGIKTNERVRNKNTARGSVGHLTNELVSVCTYVKLKGERVFLAYLYVCACFCIIGMLDSALLRLFTKGLSIAYS